MARSFNGTSDKIVYAHVAAFDGATKVTVSFWAKPNTGGTAYGYLVSQMGASSGVGNTNGWAILNNAADETSLLIAFRNNDAAPYAQTGSGILTAGAWNHIHVVYDGTQGTGADRIMLWVNNVSISLSYPGGTPPASLGTTDQAFRLGEGESLYWQGELAEVGVWSGQALTDAGLINALARALSPIALRPTVCTPLVREAADLIGNAGAPTVTGTTVVEHPRVIYPARPQTYSVAAAAPPVASFPLFQPPPMHLLAR